MCSRSAFRSAQVEIEVAVCVEVVLLIPRKSIQRTVKRTVDVTGVVEVFSTHPRTLLSGQIAVAVV